MEIRAAMEKRFIDTLGLNTAIFGQAGMDRIVQAAMQRSGIADAAAYLELLSTSQEEFEHCMEELVVPETWFFRDQEPFTLLKQHLCTQWLPSHSNDILRILSAPCATGEEPYSIAIAMREAGLQLRQFHLDAADISRRALAAAGKAVYGKGAFRHPLTAAQEKFFTGPAGERRLDETIVGAVRFHRANLIDPCFFAGQTPYDIIFCRNVLIYLTDEARQLVFANIDRLLAPDGIIFTGHAEMALLLQQGFTAVRHARSFACKRTQEPKPADVGTGTPSDFPAVRPEPFLTGGSFSAFTIPPPVPPTPLQQSLAPEVGPLHNEALALADRGQFNEAAALCGQYLREHRPHADVYCLLGLINEAAKRSGEAEECYLKALYLNPDHYETLIHLGLLCRQQGDLHQAALYRQRAEATERRPNARVGP